ncbi:MAG: DUF3291 domain-containing protein [Phototrophicaceae bacterium]
MTTYHLTQINHARLIAPIEDPRIADFRNALDEINHLAEQTEGFVWRLVGTGNDATDIQLFDDPMVIVNMSVWETIDALFAFTYRSQHVDFYRRRREWFDAHTLPTPVLWWNPRGYIPSLKDAHQRIDYMAQHGATPYAFNFKQRFSSEEAEHYAP